MIRRNFFGCLLFFHIGIACLAAVVGVIAYLSVGPIVLGLKVGWEGTEDFLDKEIET